MDKYFIVQDLADLPKFPAGSAVVVDVETSGFVPELGARICGIGVGVLDEESNWYLPVRHQVDKRSGELWEEKPLYKNLCLERVMDWMRGQARREDISWIAHNAKFETQLFWADNISFKGPFNCTMVMAHQLDGFANEFSLGALTNVFVPGFKHVWSDKLDLFFKQNFRVFMLGGKKINPVNYSKVPIELLGPYCCEDVEATRKLFRVLFSRLNEAPFSEALDFCYEDKRVPTKNGAWLADNERRLITVLSKMEYKGIAIDRKRCTWLNEKALDEQETQIEAMKRITGKRFKPSKWTDMRDALSSVGRVLFWTLPDKKKYEKTHCGGKPGIDYKGKQKGQQYTRNRSKGLCKPCFNSATFMEYLKIFKEEGNTRAYDLILASHKYSNSLFLQNNFLEKILKFSDKNNRLHCGFNQIGTGTGRLSSSRIGDIGLNLQNQPKESGTQDQEALEELLDSSEEEIEGALNRLIRSCYVPSCKDNVLLLLDFESLEYKLACFYARDEDLIRAYNENPHLDLHQDTANIIGLPQFRKVGKTCNFGILYGMRAAALAAKLTSLGYPTTFDQAASYIKKIFTKRPGLKNLIDTISAEAEEKGYIKNIFGRVVRVEKDFSYKALNLLVQGTGGDMMRRSLVAIDQSIESNKWPGDLLLTIHDEIVIDIPKRHVKDLAPRIKTIFEYHPEIDIPITSSMDIGEYNQAEKTPYEDWLKGGKKAG